jgi:hypothetical protein
VGSQDRLRRRDRRQLAERSGVRHADVGSHRDKEPVGIRRGVEFAHDLDPRLHPHPPTVIACHCLLSLAAFGSLQAGGRRFDPGHVHQSAFFALLDGFVLAGELQSFALVDRYPVRPIRGSFYGHIDPRWGCPAVDDAFADLFAVVRIRSVFNPRIAVYRHARNEWMVAAGSAREQFVMPIGAVLGVIGIHHQGLDDLAGPIVRKRALKEDLVR